MDSSSSGHGRVVQPSIGLSIRTTAGISSVSSGTVRATRWCASCCWQCLPAFHAVAGEGGRGGGSCPCCCCCTTAGSGRRLEHCTCDEELRGEGERRRHRRRVSAVTPTVRVAENIRRGRSGRHTAVTGSHRRAVGMRKERRGVPASVAARGTSHQLLPMLLWQLLLWV